MAERIAPVLGLEGVEVKEAVERGGGWEIEVEVALPGRCASCGGKVHGHGRLPRRRVSHLWIGVEAVHLNWLPKRGVCQQCGKTVATRPVGLEPWQRQTPRAQQIALIALRRQSFRAVAQDLGASPASLRRLVDRTVPLEDRSWWQIPGDLVLSVDEHSFRGTDLMITIALRSPLKRLLTILPDDRMASLTSWLKELPEEVRGRIRVVTTDLKESYRKVFAKHCPTAVVVPDPFHLVREMTRILDDVRRLEQAEIRRPIPRWPLVKGAEKLSLPQHGQLGAICRDYPALAALYALKEDFRTLLQEPDPAQAARLLARWLLNADSCDHVEGHMLANLIRKWREGLLHHWHTARRWTNGYIEGLHTKIKLLKRTSYGFTNRDRYRKKMLLAFLPAGSPHSY